MRDTQSYGRVRTSLWAGVGLLVLVATALEWRGMFRLHYVAYDYVYFYYAFRQVLEHHASFADLYNIHRQFTWLTRFRYPINPYNQYVYPPQFAVWFSPFGLLPFRISAIVWMCLSAGCYFTGLCLLCRMLWKRTTRAHVLAVCALGLIITPFEIDVGAGNVNSVLFLLVVSTFYLAYQRGRARFAGLPLAAAILIKVTPGAILLLFFLRRRWKVCTWTILWALFGTLVTGFVIGFGPVAAYATHFLSLGQTSMQNGPAPYNQSVIGVVDMLQSRGWMFPQKVVPDVFYGLFLCWVGRGVWRAIRYGRPSWRLDIALGSLMPLLFSPLVEEMHLMFALPAIMVLAKPDVSARRLQRTAFPFKVAAVVSVVLLSLPVTFLLNDITARWPSLMWMHIQMFVVLVLTYTTLVWGYRDTDDGSGSSRDDSVDRGRTGPRGLHEVGAGTRGVSRDVVGGRPRGTERRSVGDVGRHPARYFVAQFERT